MAQLAQDYTHYDKIFGNYYRVISILGGGTVILPPFPHCPH